MISRYTLLKENYKGILFLIVAVLAGIALMQNPPAGLSVAGYRAVVVFGMCVVFWVAHVLPLAITSLLAIVLLPLFGILETAEAYSLFGNSAVFFIIGALILSTGLVTTGLAERIALWVLRRSGNKPKRLLAGVYFLCVVTSFIMPEHAVAAMMLPIVLQMIHWLKLEPYKSNFGKALLLAIVWGTLTGGVATFLGGARNILAVAILEENTGLSISFTDWAVAILPISIVIAIVGFFLLQKMFPIEIDTTESVHIKLIEKRKSLGKLSDDEITMLAILVATVGAWIFLSESLGLANIAIISVVVMFLFRVVRWQDAEEHVNWGIILMYGGAIALGVALERTGAALFITNSVLDIIPVHPWVLVIGLIICTLAFTEVMSNAAVVAMLMPVALSIALTYNLNPIGIAFIIAVPAGFAFMMPMGSPPNALAYSANFYTLKDTIRAGIFMNIIALVIFIIGALVWWPLVGVSIF
ncbi:MAG: DASS family sodium-coupled anion symporter [bacterium]|nr:DASS family sodium-coupled anion symporter [bacterium]